MRAQVASILALNPLMEAADKRAFVRRFLKNAARPEEESRRLLDTGMWERGEGTAASSLRVAHERERVLMVREWCGVCLPRRCENKTFFSVCQDVADSCGGAQVMGALALASIYLQISLLQHKEWVLLFNDRRGMGAEQVYNDWVL